MARSPGSLLAALAVLCWTSACLPKKQTAPPTDPGGGEESRADIELELRGKVARVEGDACAKEAWLKEQVPSTRGLTAEVAEELLVEQASACRKIKRDAVASGDPGATPAPAGTPDPAGTPTPAPAGTPDPASTPTPAPAGTPAPTGTPTPAGTPAPPAEPVAGACSRKRAEADLRASTGRPPVRQQINAEFERCFQARLAACQLALDADIDEGLACWKAAPWPEVPASVKPEDIANTSICLVELKGVISDLRRCRAKSKKDAELDACVGPYIGYAPQCPLLKADRVWRLFPGRADVERVALARRSPEEAKALKEKEEREARQKAEEAKPAAEEAKRKAEEEARQKVEEAKRAAEEARRKAEEEKLAKETERCQGRTTLEFAERLKAQPGPRTVPGCKYQVVGRVISKNNVFVQLVDPSGALVFLLRTKEAFAENQQVADRTATFDGIEEAELADGSKRAYAVFALEPAPKKK